jgi:hypothetical protein
MNMESKRQLDPNASLMSPPEATPYESFARASPVSTMVPQNKTIYPKPMGLFPMSPPVSPYSKTDISDDPPSITVKDPILYPSQDVQSATSSQPPLFIDETVAAQRVVDGHLAARASGMFREASPPRRVEYELALEFKSQVTRVFNANRRAWFQRERAYLLEDRAVQSPMIGRRYINIAPGRGGRQTGVRNGHKGTQVIAKGMKLSPPRKRQEVTRVSATPEPGKRVAREDKDFNALPDYCPPLSTLPNKSNSLKIDWKGAPIDLRNDPFRHLLHEDEVLLAANLRLDCATYLTSKRRIFIKRIDALRLGKEFRKTDAQQACKIDVNKASKLWQAFEKVGWLNPSYVRKFF